MEACDASRDQQVHIDGVWKVVLDYAARQRKKMVAGGLEPPTLCSLAVRSNQLSYGARDASRDQQVQIDGMWKVVLDYAARQRKKMVPRGLEPRTLRLLAVRSNQLSYETR